MLSEAIERTFVGLVEANQETHFGGRFQLVRRAEMRRL